MKMFPWLLLLLLLPNGVPAAENPLRLTLAEAVTRALAGNPDLALITSQAQSAAVSVEAARGKYQPSLQAGANGSETFQHNPAPGTSGESRAVNLQLTANLNLFNGFADRAALDEAKWQQQAVQGDVQRQRETLAYEVASRFISILVDQELVQVAEQDLTSQQALQEQIKAFQKAGVRTLADLYQQQAATAQARFNLLTARRNFQVDQLQLLQLFGLETPRPVELVAPKSDALTPLLTDLSVEPLLKQAFANRIDLLAQQRRIDAAREQIRVARSGYLPSLDLQASTGSYYSSLQTGSFGGQLGDDNLSSSVGLTLTIPIFDRDQTRTSVAQAQIDKLASATRLAKLRQQVAADIGQALADYQTALQQRSTADQQLQAAHEALTVTQARYRVGAATWVELATARATAVQAEGDEVRARYAVLRQGLAIGYVRGDLVPLLQRLTDSGEAS